MEVKLVTELCRICLNDNTLISIFDNISPVKICDKIMACASVNIEIGDPLPTHICQQCYKALEVSYMFKTKCEQMDKQLRKIIEEQTVLLNQINNSTNNPSVQVCVEPPPASSESVLVENVENLPVLDTLKIETNDDSFNATAAKSGLFNDQENDAINENFLTQETVHLNGKSDPVYSNATNSIEFEKTSISSQINQNNDQYREISESNIVPNKSSDSNNTSPNDLFHYKNMNESNTTFLHATHQTISPKIANTDVENNNNSNDEIMYFDNDDFHLGEECEVITDEIFQNNHQNYLETTPSNSDMKNVHGNQLPKGKYVIIKSVIKPQNIHYVTINNFRNKNLEKPDENQQPESCIKKDNLDFPNIKTEIPEPVSYIETETITDICENQPSIEPIHPVVDNDEQINPPRCTTPVDRSLHNTPIKETKFRKRGRPKKLDKYKIPQGVSYLKSGRKNVPIFVRTRKTKRSRNAYIKDNDISKSVGVGNNGLSENVYRKTLPIVKRARVEKIIPPRKFEEKKIEPNRKLSTNLLLSDKHMNKLNDPQKQVLFQRLKLQSFRPTSKKDISERGIPKPVHLVSPKLSEDDDSSDNNDTENVRRKINKDKYSNDLSIIQSDRQKIKLKKSKLETIDQDLKLINGSSYLNTPIQSKNNKLPIDLKHNNAIRENGEKSLETTPAKTGRHTAIKSKRPQKRNHINTDNGSNTEKIEIELKMVPRKSERQRSPKKIFPEIDIFASPKRKVIEIPINELSPDYEIEKTEHNHNKFKIKIRGKRESFAPSKTTENFDVVEEASTDLKSADENSIINDDYYNEIEVETETEDNTSTLQQGKNNTEPNKNDSELDARTATNDNESDQNSFNSKLKAIKQILDKERVQLDYGAGLSCNVCNKSFPYRSHLIRHVRTHTGLKPFACEYCKKNFTSLSSLNIHVKNHIGDHPYSCEVCGRGFVQPSVLKRHMLSHTGEHPFQCQLCYKTFVHDSSLKTHLKMHTIKEPQHKCDICEKKFKYLSTLTSHLKTHSGIKPFTCPECRKAFYRRSLLTRHMRSHTKERPYKCKLCKARFAYSGGLASHKKLHTGIRPFECEICDFTFFRSSHLKNHMLKIHNNGILLTCQRCNMNFDSKPLFKRHLTIHMKKEQASQSSNNDNGNTTDSCT